MNPVVLFAALADPTRCRVLELLHERPMPVHELAAAFSISRPAISRHLRVLREASLVREEKQGRENLYSLQRQQLRPMADWLDRHRRRGPGTLLPAPVAPQTVQMEFEL
jgi:DNA-binding transcriptional ArsR family regulator